jgi:hypothetical protein
MTTYKGTVPKAPVVSFLNMESASLLADLVGFFMIKRMMD